MTTREPQADVIVVGSGPGGASLALELARGGAKVLVLERGADHRDRPWYGTYPGALVYSDRMSLLFTEEGLNIIRPLMVGGATSMFCGCAAPPPDWMRTRYGVDMDREVAEIVDELRIEPLPEDLRGEASTRIARAASSLGQQWYPQPKFMKPARARRFRCGAHCMLGCRCGAKWNAAEWVDEAVQAGATLRTGARVERVIVQDGRATGVECTLHGSRRTLHADKVVLCAGGIGTPRILQRSGMARAGEGMAMDVTVMVYGAINGEGIGNEPPMTWSWENPSEGYMLSTLMDPWLLYPIMMARQGVDRLLTWPDWGSLLGVMIKLKDDISGGVHADGRIRKPLTAADSRRLARAFETCREILVRADADPETIFMTPQRGTHPSATVRIGDMVDTDLMTEVKGLYACDASVFPEALDRPTVLTILGLGRRLARHLL